MNRTTEDYIAIGLDYVRHAIVPEELAVQIGWLRMAIRRFKVAEELMCGELERELKKGEVN